MKKREIKFRTWDKENNDWYHQPFTLREAMALQWVHKNPVADLVFMQFTGLKDKNGKEIYEADIVKQGFDDTPLGEVKFDGMGVLGIQYKKKGGTFGFCTIPHFGGGTNEVIGNIYENPELLATQ